MYMEKNKNASDELISYVIPSVNDDLRTFAIRYKVDMMEHIIHSIEHAIENKLPIAEIFQFKNSKFVITISESEFDSNIDSIYKFYMEDEIYELCPRVIKLQNILKRKNDEKKQKTTSTNNNCRNQ